MTALLARLLGRPRVVYVLTRPAGKNRAFGSRDRCWEEGVFATAKVAQARADEANRAEVARLHTLHVGRHLNTPNRPPAPDMGALTASGNTVQIEAVEVIA